MHSPSCILEAQITSVTWLMFGRSEAHKMWKITWSRRLIGDGEWMWFARVFQWPLTLSWWRETSRSTSCPTWSRAPPTPSPSTPPKDPSPAALSSPTSRHVRVSLFSRCLDGGRSRAQLQSHRKTKSVLIISSPAAVFDRGQRPLKQLETSQCQPSWQDPHMAVGLEIFTVSGFLLIRCYNCSVVSCYLLVAGDVSDCWCLTAQWGFSLNYPHILSSIMKGE